MSMLKTQVITVGPPLTIIGKDLDAGSTFNADVNPNAGKQRAGRFMAYNPATQQLTPWDATGDAAGATIFGILSDGFDNTDNMSTVSSAAMVYREGVFLRQEIESANNVAIPPGSALDLKLNDLGLFLEQSYEGYVGLNPVPAGVVPLSDATSVNPEPQNPS